MFFARTGNHGISKITFRLKL